MGKSWRYLWYQTSMLLLNWYGPSRLYQLQPDPMFRRANIPTRYRVHLRVTRYQWTLDNNQSWEICHRATTCWQTYSLILWGPSNYHIWAILGNVLPCAMICLNYRMPHWESLWHLLKYFSINENNHSLFEVMPFYSNTLTLVKLLCHWLECES